MADSPKEVWITGIGIVSSLGEGLDAHWQALTADKPKPVVDEKSFAPYPIHPICDLDFSKQIPKRGDLRQMEDWQRIGTYAAGLALDDAKIKGDEDLLAKTHIIAAAANGERDPVADANILEVIAGDAQWRDSLNEQLLKHLRPTLYLAQQTQLLAGNISIVHKVTGGSRTYKGEEMAGVQIVENAVQRIQAGQGELFLVGASYNAARWDQLLINELNGRGAGLAGSMGIFLVLESEQHAQSRRATPYARIKDMNVPSSRQHDLQGAGIELKEADGRSLVGDLANLFGRGVEAQFSLAVALASIACSKQAVQALILSGNMSAREPLAVIEKVGP